MVTEEKGLISELLDTTNLILSDFRTKCPGTYKHAQYVASIVEGVSATLGLPINEMKVAALYHDIGKKFNPLYFSENQPKDSNIHDGIDPWLSYQIISRHVSDGVCFLLNIHDFPRDLIEIISQHHGTMVVRYFANKAEKDGKSIDLNDFRYHNTKPKTMEAAVLMVCDQVEAISRSLTQKGAEANPEEVVEKTIHTLMEDGQLDIVTVGSVRKIKNALISELSGTDPKRVDYEEVIIKPKKNESKES